MRSTLTRVAITLIALNALLAIVILLGGDMGETGGRILGTSLLATGTALLAMVLVPAAVDRRIGLAPHLSIVAAVVGFVIVTAGIWTSVEGDFGWKVAGSGYTLAIAGAAASLLSGLPIAGRARWVATATVWLVGAGAAMVIGAIWWEIGGDAYWRFFGVIGVLVAAGALAIPILHRSAKPVQVRHAETVYHCPFCGARTGPQDAAEVACPACGRRFAVSLLEEPVRSEA